MVWLEALQAGGECLEQAVRFTMMVILLHNAPISHCQKNVFQSGYLCSVHDGNQKKTEIA